MEAVMEIIIALFGFLILVEVIYIEIRLRQQISFQKQMIEKLDALVEAVRKRRS
ncbi:hypothetical protein XYCOK13_24390 [Xylanibacillus composti]|uniref:DUF4083 domain-containing protein n=1 Tax=Xylanibacillus composti TaxID=1572762 RepID=A0A8J4M295_9BACL|nr:hypothetical protein XYCOK13_24390 [Xylanibacillus composti]